MAVNTETEINLKTLQRVDSNIVEIIDHASQVAIYKYETKLNKWEGTDIEGTLFLYKRSLYPFHGFIIVNRMSTTNFIEAITSDMEFVLEKPYFLYKNSYGEIIGSWFYEDKDFRRITNRIQSIVLKQTSTTRRQRCSSDSDTHIKKDEVAQDIMSLLNEAHTEYVKAELRRDIISDLNNEINTAEDFNNLATYTDKKINNKSFNIPGQKEKKSCLRSASEEKFRFSPRKRFFSSCSYDATYSQRFIPDSVMHMLVANGEKINMSSNFKNNCASSKIIEQPVSSANCVSLDQINAPSHFPDATIFEKAAEFQNIKVPKNMNITDNLSNIECSNNDMLNSKTAVKKNSSINLHASNLKDCFLSHIENDSDIIVKIHEAYVASLKSLFVQK